MEFLLYFAKQDDDLYKKILRSNFKLGMITFVDYVFEEKNNVPTIEIENLNDMSLLSEIVGKRLIISFTKESNFYCFIPYLSIEIDKEFFEKNGLSGYIVIYNS